MVAKLGIHVCPVPGCVTISGRSGSVCPEHPNRALVREVYEHRPKPGSRPGDLGSKPNPFDFKDFGFDDLLGGLFGGKR